VRRADGCQEDIMKIAAAAYPIDWHNRWNDYVGKLRVWVRTAAEQGAELIVFPELAAMELASLAGEANARDPQRSIDAVTARIKDVDDLHASLAREFRLHICAGSAPLRQPDRGAVNRVRLFAPDGGRGHQDKLVLTPFERDGWGLVPGDGARVFDTAVGRLGILVSHDAEFPMIARAMAEAGAEVLLVPSATDSPRAYWRVRVGAMARALENQCAVVQAVTVGDADWLPPMVHSHGAAAIFGPPDAGFPDDGVVTIGKADTAGWVHGEVAPEAVRTLRDADIMPTLLQWQDQAARITPVETLTLGAAPEAPSSGQ
jgi:predicted amidohydrolase